LYQRSTFKISNRNTFYSDRPVEVIGVILKQNSPDNSDTFRNKEEVHLSVSAITGRRNYAERIKKSQISLNITFLSDYGTTQTRDQFGKNVSNFPITPE
jgi:hypothetical protein